MQFTYLIRLIIFFIGISLISGLKSQTRSEPFADKKAGKIYYISPIEHPPKIDGKLTESIWEVVNSISDFVQEDPDYLSPPTEKTAVYLTFDKQAIFLAARLYDSEPGKIRRQLAPHDDWYSAFDNRADWFSFELDSRHDHQTGFSFAVNASGVLCDEMIYNDENYDSDWNAIWDAAVSIDETGWTLEMEIPFSMLRFNEGDILTWGMNFTRYIQRKDETITWMPFPEEVEGVASKFGHLTGLQGIYPPAKLEFRPYGLEGQTSYRDIILTYPDSIPNNHENDFINDPQKKIGLDVKYKINPNSTIMVAFNPDFGQVEVDPQDINLTAFETYFAEKRPFFLENAALFQTPLEVFYSRRIGQDEWIMKKGREGELIWENSPTLIKGAGKITGKTESGFSYGSLVAIITLDSSVWREQMMKGKNNYYFINRLKWDILGGNSYFGFINTMSLRDSLDVYSIDGMTNFFGNRLGVDGQYLITNDKTVGYWGRLSFSPYGFMNGWIDLQSYQKGLNINDLGYLRRNDYQSIFSGVKLQTMNQIGVFRNLAIFLDGKIERNQAGINLGKTVEIKSLVQFSNYWEVLAGGYYMDEHWDDRLIFLDVDEYGPPIFKPAIGGYQGSISTNPNNLFSSIIYLDYAYNAWKDFEFKKEIGFTFNPNPYLSFEVTYYNYLLEKKYHWLEVIQEEIDSTISTDIGLKDTTYINNHYIFSKLDHRRHVFTMRASANINRHLSLELFSEFFISRDLYSNYLEHIPDSSDYFLTPFILGEDDWLGQPAYDSTDVENSLLDPNLYCGFFPKFTSFNLNCVLKYHYTKGSNIYLVYTLGKSVNGENFKGLNGLSDFFSFGDPVDWVELYRDQTFLIKIDYWFDY